MYQIYVCIYKPTCIFYYVYWANKEKEQIIWSILSYFRVVNVSSMSSQMSISKCSAAIKDKFKQPDISMDQLKALIQQFIEWVNISLFPCPPCKGHNTTFHTLNFCLILLSLKTIKYIYIKLTLFQIKCSF